MDIINPLPPAIITAVTGQPLREIIRPIGTWNMDVQATKAVPTSIPRPNIHIVQVLILHDTASNKYPINYIDVNGVSAGSWHNVTTGINLVRTAGKFFDSISFDNAVMNRGFVTIWYEL